MSINEEVLNETVDMFEGHLFDYRHDINLAYLDADDALSVSLRVKYSPNGSGVKIDTSIEFVKEKIKDKNSKISGGPRQMTLGEINHEPKEGPGITAWKLKTYGVVDVEEL